MLASNSSSLLQFLIFFLFLLTFASLSFADQLKEVGDGLIGRRGLKSFKETPNGGNVTFDCSPSGPCVLCAYSEKNDEKYRCSETGYRIPLKCIMARVGSKAATTQKSQKGRSALENTYSEVKAHRRLLDEASTSDGASQSYITYRSCIPAVSEEKLSVLGFEGIILGLLLLSGSAIYFRRKRTSAAPGGGLARVSSNSRF